MGLKDTRRFRIAIDALRRVKVLRRAARMLRGDILHKPEIALPHAVTLGTKYGAHTISTDGLNRDSVVYSFGIGTDASFDLALIERVGCHVYGFDPTPGSAAWVGQNVREPKFIFAPIGLAASRKRERVGAPEIDTHISHFKVATLAAPPAHTIEFELVDLEGIRADLGHAKIDALKMDIEGFEYEVVASLDRTVCLPKQMLVEFHHNMHGFSKDHTNEAVSQLRALGYKLFHVSETGHEYSFVLS